MAGLAWQIAKQTGDGLPSELWRVSVADGSAHKVGLNADWVPFLAVPGRQSTSFHPDGRQVAFLMGESKLEIWTLENFLPTLGAKK